MLVCLIFLYLTRVYSIEWLFSFLHKLVFCLYHLDFSAFSRISSHLYFFIWLAVLFWRTLLCYLCAIYVGRINCNDWFDWLIGSSSQDLDVNCTTLISYFPPVLSIAFLMPSIYLSPRACFAMFPLLYLLIGADPRRWSLPSTILKH